MATFTLAIVVFTLAFSYQAFKDSLFFKKLSFDTHEIFVGKQYYRLLSHCLTHVSWQHFAFNMLSLLVFGMTVELVLGSLTFSAIYILSVIGGALFTLYMHRHHEYSMVGASGGICGIVFSSIILFPGIDIMFIPGWLYGLLYIAFSLAGMRGKAGNIGHEAHFGGALVGMLAIAVLHPEEVSRNYVVFLLLLIPSLFIILLIIKRPGFFVFDGPIFGPKKKHYDIDEEFNYNKVIKQKEIDRILEKISKKGVNSLTDKERKTLDGF